MFRPAEKQKNLTKIGNASTVSLTTSCSDMDSLLPSSLGGFVWELLKHWSGCEIEVGGEEFGSPMASLSARESDVIPGFSKVALLRLRTKLGKLLEEMRQPMQNQTTIMDVWQRVREVMYQTRKTVSWRWKLAALKCFNLFKKLRYYNKQSLEIIIC